MNSHMHACMWMTCLYTRAFFGTNLFSVTTAKVGLTQIKTRCLINERAFCLKGSVLNHIHLRCWLCHCTGPRTLCTLGMNLQQKLHILCDWRPRFTSSHVCPSGVCAACGEHAKYCSLMTYTSKWLEGHGSTSARGRRGSSAASSHISSQKMMRACQEPAQRGTLTWGISVINWVYTYISNLVQSELLEWTSWRCPPAVLWFMLQSWITFGLSYTRKCTLEAHLRLFTY